MRHVPGLSRCIRSENNVKYCSIRLVGTFGLKGVAQRGLAYLVNSKFVESRFGTRENTTQDVPEKIPTI